VRARWEGCYSAGAVPSWGNATLFTSHGSR